MTALWVVVPRLTFANSCLATVFYAVGMVMVSQNGHIGSRLKAMVVIPGAWTVGSVCGGITVSSSSSHSHLSDAKFALRCAALRCIAWHCVALPCLCGLWGMLFAQGFQVAMGYSNAANCTAFTIQFPASWSLQSKDPSGVGHNQLCHKHCSHC